MKIAVTGGRKYRLTEFETEDMAEFVRCSGVTEFRDGGCSGADVGARRGAGLGSFGNIRFVIYPADWKTFGKAAGPVRNERMLTGEHFRYGCSGNVDLLIAYPGDRGTENCIIQARNHGIEVCPSFAIAEFFDDRPSPRRRWSDRDVRRLFL